MSVPDDFLILAALVVVALGRVPVLEYKLSSVSAVNLDAMVRPPTAPVVVGMCIYKMTLNNR